MNTFMNFFSQSMRRHKSNVSQRERRWWSQYKTRSTEEEEQEEEPDYIGIPVNRLFLHFQEDMVDFLELNS